MPKALQVLDPVDDALAAHRPDFHVLTGSLRVKEDGGDRPHVMATASSTAIDLEADRFTATALKQMKDGFVGKIIFLNHSYKVPHDVFGVVQGTELVKREGRLDLDLDIMVETNNPLAVQTYEYIKGGTVLGVSVGVIVTEAEKNKNDEEDERGRTVVDINGVIPLEASIVGIPANQTAWTRDAVKSLFASGRIAFSAEEIAARPWLQTVKEADMATKHTEEEAAAQAEAEAAAAAQAEEAAAAEAETPTEPETAAAAAAPETPSDAGATATPETPAEATPETPASDEPVDPDDEVNASAQPEAALAVWSTAFINNLPDSAFAVILGGGKKDEDGKTTPRNLRKLPHHGTSGAVDKPHLRNALSREPQTKMPAAAHAKAKAHLNRHAKAEGMGGGKELATLDFDDDVAADQAADVLVNKMFSGFRIALHNLIEILINTDNSLADRQKAGDEVVEAYQSFIAETWDETIEELGDNDKEIAPVNLDSYLHAALSKAEGVVCDVPGYTEVAAKVAEIGDGITSLTTERDTLRKESEQKDAAIKYLESVIEVMMELPLPTVTTNGKDKQDAQSLAQRFPALDNRVVERMARYAPSADPR